MGLERIFLSVFVFFSLISLVSAAIPTIQYSGSFNAWLLTYYCRPDYQRILNHLSFGFVNESSITLYSDMVEDSDCVDEVGDWTPMALEYYRRISDGLCVGFLLNSAPIDHSVCDDILTYYSSTDAYMKNTSRCQWGANDPDSWYNSPNLGACYQQYGEIYPCFPPVYPPQYYCYCTEEDRLANDGYCARTHFITSPQTGNIELNRETLIVCNELNLTNPPSWGYNTQIIETSCIKITPSYCEFCDVLDINCTTDVLWADQIFDVNYSFMSSGLGYPYEIRTLYSGEYEIGKFDQCNYLENVTPDCEVHKATFKATCPDGFATHIEDGIPVADVQYSVGCASSATPSQQMCYESTDQKILPTCSVKCRYCSQDMNLIFNVTAPGTTSAICELNLWYNDSSGGWCKILPDSDGCATLAYTNIGGGDKSTFTPDTYSIFQLTNLVAPTQYLWNVHCSGPSGEAYAQNNWTFKTRCT